MINSNRFDSVKVGDTMVEKAIGMNYRQLTETTVIKVTDTQITVKNGTRYLKSNGYKFGEGNKTRGVFHFIGFVGEE